MVLDICFLIRRLRPEHEIAFVFQRDVSTSLLILAFDAGLDRGKRSGLPIATHIGDNDPGYVFYNRIERASSR